MQPSFTLKAMRPPFSHQEPEVPWMVWVPLCIQSKVSMQEQLELQTALCAITDKALASKWDRPWLLTLEDN